MATKQQISKCLCDTLEKARAFLCSDVGIDTDGAKPDKSNIDNFLEQARQRAILRLEKGFWNAERNRREMFESIGSARESLSQEIAKAIQATQSENGDNCKPPKTRKRIKHIPYKQALAILEKLNCPKDRRTLQRWMKGENTPDDFTPETMTTVQFFAAWATIYANREQSKINTNNTLRIDNPNSRKMQKFR